MDLGTTLNILRDPAGIPFYPVVFQGLYVLTWALHAAFVLLALGGMTLSIVGATKQKSSANWKLLTGHMVQTSKLSVSLLILLGIAPLLFTQVIYDPNWYVVNSLSGVWVFVFVYALLAGYMLLYWFYYANKKGSSGSVLIGVISLLILVFAGLLMHVFAYESIQPDKWMEWYAPGGVIDTSGLNFHFNPVRLLFLVTLSAPTLGIFLLNYSDFVSTRDDFTPEYISFVRDLGKKIATFGLLASAVLFAGWMLLEGLLLNPLSLAIVVSVVVLLLMVRSNITSYFTTGVLVIAALLISALREYIRFDLMSGLGYNIYDYPMNIDWPSVIMFLLTFVVFGFTAIGWILTMAWKVGKTQGVFDASKDPIVTKLANATVAIVLLWCVVYFGWGMFTLFKNTIV
ncbi:hypothetical protein [Sulfurimonas diazotrophicus]|uniref:Uncharacterized protein n=1 Tax=Sulfurimonas diazotrophicus TaxID=3131939 RepID=A0ABZ3HA32_9BACT